MAQWLQATEQNNTRDRSRPTKPFSTMEKHTGSHRHDQHIKHMPKKGGGGTGGSREGDRSNCLLGLRPISPPHEATGCSSLTASSLVETKAFLVSIT